MGWDSSVRTCTLRLSCQLISLYTLSLIGMVARDTHSFFLGGILYLWHSGGIKHFTMILKGFFFFSPWEHLIVTYCFCCFCGYCAFLLPLSTALMWPASCVSLCVMGRGHFKDTSNTETPGYEGPISSQCVGQPGVLGCVSLWLIHLCFGQRQRALWFPEAFFMGRISKSHLNSMSSFKKKKQLDYNCFVYSSPIWLFAPSFSPSHCDYQPYLSKNQG